MEAGLAVGRSIEDEMPLESRAEEEKEMDGEWSCGRFNPPAGKKRRGRASSHNDHQ